MELILKKDVPNLGFKDDVVTVKNGYGRNYLIPQGFAVLATPSEKKVLEETLRQRVHKEKQVIAEAQEIAERLKELTVKIPAKVGSGDKLFGSVTHIDLAEALQKEGETIDRKFISIQGGSVKRTGPYMAKIRLHREVVLTLPFEVIAEAK